MSETCTVCRTSLSEWSTVYCPHGRAFCDGCAWWLGCEKCDGEDAA